MYIYVIYMWAKLNTIFYNIFYLLFVWVKKKPPYIYLDSSILFAILRERKYTK